MTERRILPQRRRAETFDLEFGGLERRYAVTLGFYDDGAVGEVFISGGKSGQTVEAIARDGAVLLSLALQHGAPLESIAGAITRDGQGAPASIVGAVIDQLQGSQLVRIESRPVTSERRVDGALTGRGPVAPSTHTEESD